MLMSDWEELLKNEAFEPVHDALHSGIALLEKYYHCANDTNVYFISHSKSSPIVTEFSIKTRTYSLGPGYKTCIS